MINYIIIKQKSILIKSKRECKYIKGNESLFIGEGLRFINNFKQIEDVRVVLIYRKMLRELYLVR